MSVIDGKLIAMRWTIRTFFLGTVVGFAALWWLGSHFSAPVPADIGQSPASLQAQSISIPTAQGRLISAWYGEGDKSEGAVLLLHGVRANRLAMVGRAIGLQRRGYTILMIDFQAHGESVGEHITFGYREAADADAAYQFLRSRVAHQPIAVIGVSMGGAAALLGRTAAWSDAIVLEAVYPTIDQAITNRLVRRLGFLGRFVAPLLTWQIDLRLGIAHSELRPIEQIGSIRVPVMVATGSADLHTLLEESQTMFAAAREPKALWVVAGAEHEDLMAFAPSEYERRVFGFIDSHLRGAH